MLALRPKPFAVLTYLVSHAGQLITKEALFEAIWPETVVSDTVLKACIRQIRQVLGDTARTSRFILTVHRRGYRFIAPVTEVNQTPDIPIEPVIPLATDDVPALAQPSARRTSGTLTDRDAELRQLHAWLAAAARGERQVLFVTGEPGSGAISSAGRGNRQPASCASRGDRLPDTGFSLAQSASGNTGPSSARARRAARTRTSPHGQQGLCGPGGRPDIHPGAPTV
jgi:DNA-binding winged helix-turn-helix (wHTH) protein